MEMAEEAQIRESRGNRRVVPGGRNRKPNIKVLVFLPLAVCCVVGATADVYLSRQRTALVPQQGLTYEANVVPGGIPGRTREQHQKELDNVVEEGMLAMSTNVAPFRRTTGVDRSINQMVENPSNQRKLIRTEITRNDTGEKTFETGAIRPGNYLESGPLLISLLAGEYDCITVFLAYQEETETPMGQAVVRIKLALQE